MTTRREAELSNLDKEWKEYIEHITDETFALVKIMEEIAIAKDCEGYGEVLGGKLMDKAREALKRFREGEG